MTFEQLAHAIMKQADRLEKDNDRLRSELVGANAIIDNLSPRLSAALERIELLQDEKEEWQFEGGGAANGGESQALQAAILGLHTLAGEFPTPTWKTREDYLQATISEINEILGKQ